MVYPRIVSTELDGLFCKIIEKADLERLKSPLSPAAPLIAGQRIHKRRGSGSNCVVIPSQYSTIVHHAEPEILRQVLIAIFWG